MSTRISLPNFKCFMMLKITILAVYLLCLDSTSAQEYSMSTLTTLITIFPTTWKDEQHCGNSCYNEFYWTYNHTFDSEYSTNGTISLQVPVSGDISFSTASLYGLTSATIINEYGSWQEVWSEGVCTDMASIVTLKSIATFFGYDLQIDSSGNLVNTASLSSMIISRIGRPVCTKSTYTQAISSISLPTVIFPLQTSVNIVETLSTDTELSQAAKISIGMAIGIGSGFIFSFLAFFIWRRYLGNRILQKNLEHSGVVAFEDKYRVQAESQVQEKRQASLWRFRLSKYQHIGRQEIAHWTAPLAILSGLAVGVTLAIGHHYTYANVTGQPVDDHRISQSWMLRFGTLLAFLVKVSFGTSVGVAFSQLQWLEIRRKSLSVGEIDTVSNVLGDLLNFVHRIWLLFPILTLLATIWWLLSLVPVMTPGSLNVISLAHQQSLLLTALQLNISIPWSTYPPTASLTMIYPPPALTKILFSAALGGQTLFSAPQNPNQSFHLNFLAPAVDCHPADASITAMVAMLGMADYSYVAWAGNDYWMNKGVYPSKLDLTSTDAARLCIAFPGYPNSLVNIDGDSYYSANVTECLLYNASYSTDFVYRNSELSVQISNVSFENYVSVTSASLAATAYLSFMWGLGELLVGSKSDIIEYTLVDLLHGITNDTVKPAVEELFRNMTLSVLMSGNSLLTINDTVMGQVTAYRTTYEYKPSELFTVYGLAFLLTLLCSAIGCYAFLVNGGSYRNTFSTFIRATNSCEIPIEENDTGIEPCPQSLDRAQVNVTPKSSGLAVPRSAEEERLIDEVPIPPASTHMSSSPRDASPIFQAASLDAPRISRFIATNSSPSSTNTLLSESTTFQLSLLSSRDPTPTIQIPERVAASDRNEN